MIKFNEAEIKQKIENNYNSWVDANCIGTNGKETIDKLCNFIDAFNVRPFVKRDLKRYIKKHHYWATEELLTSTTASEFKERAECCEQIELAIK